MDTEIEDLFNQSLINETAVSHFYMSTAEMIFTAVTLSFIILSTVFGNVLVIIAVFNYRPLRSVQNMFIVSLAVADIAVALLVMPLNVAYTLMGLWDFGLLVCKLWLTCDVLCCTASILNLCAIALDRYWAIHDPINYARKRTLNRVLFMIFLVWIVSLLISAPPLIGWNDWPEEFMEDTPCTLTKERGYVIYSASGSFYIPLVIMMTVYLKIFQAAKQRIRVKAKAVINVPAAKQPSGNATLDIPLKSDISTIAVTDDSTSTSVSPKVSDQKNSHSPAETELKVDSDECTPTTPTHYPSNEIGRNARSMSTVRRYMKERQKICLLKERRAARVLGIVMGVFVLCWLPFFLMYVILPFCENCYISDRIINFLTWLGYVNSALNPVIYTIFNLDFRKAFSEMLCRRKR